MDPVSFRALALVALALDARPGFSLRRAQRAMSEPERAEIVRVLRRLPAVVAEWSEGNAGFDELRIDVLDRPLRRLSMTSPGRWWVGPDDVGELLAERAPRGRWDSVFLVYPTDGSFTPCGWACTVGPTPVAGGAGFSSITSDRWEPDQHRLFPEEGFVHEWLHQVEGMYRPVGLGHSELPDLHDVADRTSARSTEVSPYGRGYVDYERETGTWQPWYRDLMTGTVGTKDGERPPLGLTPERWARRRH
jgi:hypothetical protein